MFRLSRLRANLFFPEWPAEFSMNCVHTGDRKTVRKIRQLWKLVKIPRLLRLDKGDPFSPPYIATADFTVGDRLAFYGDYLYRVDPGGHLPATFVARRNIKAGEYVYNDPTDPKRSDLMLLI